MSQVRKLTVYKAFVNNISSYPLFSGFSGSFLDKILVTYSFQPDLEDFAQHLSIKVRPSEAYKGFHPFKEKALFFDHFQIHTIKTTLPLPD